MDKNYWQGRDHNYSVLQKITKILKRRFALFSLINFFTSNRTGDEYFIACKLKKYKPKIILDIACGKGKDILVNNSNYVIGVDIKGFPESVAKSRGYSELYTYFEPEYNFSVRTSNVDMITCINLNAHIPFGSLAKILKNSISYLKKGGQVLFVNEYDNNSLTYKFFNKNSSKKKKFVDGMEHYYFHTEDFFMEKIMNEIPGLILLERETIVCMTSIEHNYAYNYEKKPSQLLSFLFRIVDLFRGLINSIFTLINPKNKGFLVGHLFIIKYEDNKKNAFH